MALTVFLWIIYGCLLSLLVLGAWLFQKLSQWSLLDRLIVASMPAVSFLLGVLMLNKFLILGMSPFGRWGGWNGARLAPTFALTHDYPLYSSADSGSVLNTIYGPVTALAYLPATLTSSPTAAVILASLLSPLLFFLPIFWLHVGDNWRNLQQTIVAFSAFIGFCFLALGSIPLSESAFLVHADAPALGLGASACAVLYYRKHKDRIPALFLSATFAVLAVWTKQVALPIPFALLTYVLLADGRRCFQRYALCFCVSGTLISAILIVAFNPQPLFFNILTLPSHHPWWFIDSMQDIPRDNKIQAIKALFLVFIELTRRSFIPLIIIVFSVICQYLFLSRKKHIREARFKVPRTWINSNRWSLFMIVGAFSVPTSMLGRVKVGGIDNTLSYTIYFLLAAATLSLINFTDPEAQALNKINKISILLILTISVAINLPLPLDHIYYQLKNIPSNQHQVAYNYAKNHPNEAYFPWHPLSSLLAEKKLYHFAFGILDRELAGFPLSDRHFRAYLPSNLQLIAYPNWASGFVKGLPEFSKKVEIDELPGWKVYVKP
jgi:hypothetical protein